MKRISLLGSTGSIGRTTLDVIRHLGQSYEIVALAAHSQVDLIEKQVREFQPKLVALYDEKAALELQKRVPHLPVLSGLEGLKAVAAFDEANFVVSAITGFAGMQPTLAAIEAGKDVGLANKESLITAGDLIMQKAKEKKVKIIPIDSEHSALFQCLHAGEHHEVKKLILTASGGPFFRRDPSDFHAIRPEDALNHPNWDMGPKVTIDSSTLMNKGLEVIEAHYLFQMPLDQIEVIIHPQSIIHSMVDYVDGSMIAQMGIPDMAIPIQYALTYPERKRGIRACLDLRKYSKLELHEPNYTLFPCLALAFEAAKKGKSLPCFMNGANEILVSRFLNGQIKWTEIGEILEKLMSNHSECDIDDVSVAIEVDQEARKRALTIS